MNKVLCVGDSCADVIIPYGLAKQHQSANAYFSCGGACANSAYGLAKLGCDVAFVGKAGDDLYGREMKEQLAEVGVNVDHFVLDSQMVSTQVLCVIDEKGERENFLMPAENSSYLQIKKEDLCDASLDCYKYVLTNGMMLFDQPCCESISAFLQRVKTGGTSIIVDINYRGEMAGKERKWFDLAMELADYVLGSDEDFTGLNLEVESLTKQGKTVIVHNSKGADLISDKLKFHCDSYHVDVVDTLGAGDSFNSGFIYGLTNGMPLQDSVKAALGYAAINVSSKGARNNCDRSKLEEFLRG